MAKVDVGEVWGIGPASERKLIGIGVEKVAQLRDLDLTLARRLLSVVGEKTVLELRGVQCLARSRRRCTPTLERRPRRGS